MDPDQTTTIRDYSVCKIIIRCTCMQITNVLKFIGNRVIVLFNRVYFYYFMSDMVFILKSSFLYPISVKKETRD